MLEFSKPHLLCSIIFCGLFGFMRRSIFSCVFPVRDDAPLGALISYTGFGVHRRAHRIFQCEDLSQTSMHTDPMVWI